MNEKYKDIINKEHSTSKTHPRMAMSNRAAQFSPFAALSGYEEAVREEGRMTKSKALLSEDRKAVLNNRLNLINEILVMQSEVTITYFAPDDKKSGGNYLKITGLVKKMDTFKKVVIMQNEQRIPVEDIVEIDVGEADY